MSYAHNKYMPKSHFNMFKTGGMFLLYHYLHQQEVMFLGVFTCLSVF